jgi:hypothetical protein
VSLFGPLYGILHLSPRDRHLLERGVVALETIVAKLDDPAVPPALEQAATRLGVSTEALRDALAAADAATP